MRDDHWNHCKSAQPIHLFTIFHFFFEVRHNAAARSDARQLSSGRTGRINLRSRRALRCQQTRRAASSGVHRVIRCPPAIPSHHVPQPCCPRILPLLGNFPIPRQTAFDDASFLHRDFLDARAGLAGTTPGACSPRTGLPIRHRRTTRSVTRTSAPEHHLGACCFGR